MATEFKILRGSKDTLIDKQGNSLIPVEKLVNGYWYLTNDTAEVYVCLEIDDRLVLKKVNECSGDDWDELRIDDIERRLTALEEQGPDVLTLTNRNAFPSIGQPNVLYVDTEQQQSYVWMNGTYVVIGGSAYEEPNIIYGGSAD